jgi:hypothetical protein
LPFDGAGVADSSGVHRLTVAAIGRGQSLSALVELVALRARLCPENTLTGIVGQRFAIRSAARSAYSVATVLLDRMEGITEASATRRPMMPCTHKSLSTTDVGVSPIAQSQNAARPEDAGDNVIGSSSIG